MADSRKDAWASEDSLPIREIDDQQPDKGDGTSCSNDGLNDGAIRSIVPAPRPFTYRNPVGTSDPETVRYPRRRRTDPNPQK